MELTKHNEIKPICGINHVCGDDAYMWRKILYMEITPKFGDNTYVWRGRQHLEIMMTCDDIAYM